MPYSLRYLPKVVLHDIPQLPAGLRKKIRMLIEASLMANPSKKGKALLHSLSDYRRLRIGHYRVVYRVDEDSSEVTIVAIGHRSEVYEKLSSIH